MKLNCPECGADADKVIFLGLPMKLCREESCSTLRGFWSDFAVWFPVSADGESFAFTVYEGSYLKALWHWLGLCKIATLAILSAFLALPATAAEPCAGSLALWTATQTGSNGSQSLVVGSRAEGACDTGVWGSLAWARTDAEALPDTTVSLTDPSTYRNVAGVSAWVGLSKPVAGPISLAVFGGKQWSLQGGALGHGTSTTSGCLGLRADYGGGYAVGGICNRFAPVVQRLEQDGTRQDDPAAVGTIVMPIKSNVKLATNAALRLNAARPDWILTVGSTVGLKF